MATKRIFIAGHGVVSQSNTEDIGVDVNFFVIEGDMFNYYFTPGFIQAIMQGKEKAGFDINDLIKAINPTTPHQKETVSLSNLSRKHLLYLSENDSYPKLANGFNSNRFKNVCNKGIYNEKYSFITNDSPFQKNSFYSNEKFEARYGNPNYRYKLNNGDLDNETSLNNDCILIWPKTGERPTSATENNYVSLGDIITWAQGQYPEDDCEFYWFACREYI